MVNNIRRIVLSGLVAAVAAVALSGCSVTKEEVGEDTQTVVDVQTPEVTDIETEQPEDVTEPEIPEVPKEPEIVIPEFVNKLTGLECTEEVANARPVAIMINNIKVATPQQGITKADIIYEVLAEGGITRLLCVFADYKNLPETGSIRSSRDYFIDLSDVHDAIYVHCGGSPAAYETLAARKTENLDGMYIAVPFFRNAERKKNMGYEHSLMTTGEKLVAGIEKKQYRTTSDKEQPLSFALIDTAVDGGSAKYAKLALSRSYVAEFDYDEESGIYTKKQFGKPHIDSNDNSQLAFENVIFLYCTQGEVKGDDKGRIYVNFKGTGEGYFMSNGAYKSIKWYKESRTSTYTLYEEDGVTELLLNPGKTYIAIATPDAETIFE